MSILKISLMKIKYKNPWFFFILKWFFPGLDPESSIITFGDTIYSKRGFPDDVLIHEGVHIKQQHGSKIFAVFFTILFIASPKFRLKVELEAYREQYRSLVGICPNLAKGVLDRSARDLSGPLYNNLITYERAIALIRHDRAVRKFDEL